jgi:hypothetical protein
MFRYFQVKILYYNIVYTFIILIIFLRGYPFLINMINIKNNTKVLLNFVYLIISFSIQLL